MTSLAPLSNPRNPEKILRKGRQEDSENNVIRGRDKEKERKREGEVKRGSDKEMDKNVIRGRDKERE